MTDRTSSADERHSGLQITHPTDEIAVVEVSVELDMDTAAPLTRSLTDQLTAGCRLLVVDLTACEFMGSPGLAALTEVHGLARRENATFAVVGCNTTVQRTITVTGLNGVLNIYPSTQDAIAALATG